MTSAPPGFQRLDRLTARQVDELLALYREEWWTDARTRADVGVMLDNTAVVVAFAQERTGELVAFARVVSDLRYHATLLDVIVRADHRGTGLGDALLEAVTSHPQLAHVAVMQLRCRTDKVAFYERHGFEACATVPVVPGRGAGVEMRRRRPATD